MQAWWTEENSLNIIVQKLLTGNVHFIFSKINYTGNSIVKVKVTSSYLTIFRLFINYNKKAIV